MEPFPLPQHGLDLFYIDESAGPDIFVMTAVRVPMLRPGDDEPWWVTWPHYYEQARAWRRALSMEHHLKFRKEIHSSDFLAGKGKIHKDGRVLTRAEAAAAFRFGLQTLGFLEDASIVVTAATAASKLFGETRMQASLTALLQRLERQTSADRVGAMVFFDEGHREYWTLYRKSQAYLPVGSRLGGWATGKTKSLPLSHFIEDGNIKQSKDSYLLQVADMVAYAALQKLKHEAGKLPDWRIEHGHHALFDEIPQQLINLKATAKRKDGIVPV